MLHPSQAIEPGPVLFMTGLTTHELLFTLALTAGIIAVILGIHAEAVMGTVMFLLIYLYVDIFGAHIYVAIAFLVLAGLIRGVFATGDIIRQKLAEANPETLALLATIIAPIVDRVFGSNDPPDRENP